MSKFLRARWSKPTARCAPRERPSDGVYLHSRLLVDTDEATVIAVQSVIDDELGKVQVPK